MRRTGAILIHDPYKSIEKHGLTSRAIRAGVDPNPCYAEIDEILRGPKRILKKSFEW